MKQEAKHTEKTYRVGDVTVTKVLEQPLAFATPEWTYPDHWEPRELERHADLLGPGNMDASKEHFLQSVHGWLVRTPEHTILVDAGSGNDKERLYFPLLHHQNTPFLENFAAAGVSPEDVDYVLLTHLHVDHVGWNTRLVDGEWVPTFPNARYVFSRAEEEYFADPANYNENNMPNFGLFEDSVAPVVAAGLADRIKPDGGEYLDGFTFRPTPGHSVNHMSILLRSGGEEAMFSGDLLHSVLQVYRPEWNSVFDEWRDDGTVASRRWALGYAADHDVLWLSTHLPETSAGRVTRDGDGFSWRYE